MMVRCCMCNRITLHAFLAFVFLLIWFVGTYLAKRRIQKTLPNAYYFQQDLERRDVSQNYLNTYSRKQPENPEIIIGIVTAHRNYGVINFKYAHQVVGTFLKMQENQTDISTFLCTANAQENGPTTFLENLFEDKYHHRLHNARSEWTTQKELKDYISCLSIIKKNFPSVKYIVLNEDDGLPLQYFHENIKLIIQQVVFNMKHRQLKNVSHVKLHHPTTLRKIPYLIFAFAIPLSILSLMKWFCLEFQINITNFTLLVVGLFMFSIVYVAGSTTIGRLHQHISPSFFPLVAPESCCTVSVLFLADNLQATIDYLLTSSKDRPLSPKDTLLDDLPSKTGMKVYMTEYNLVQHIGIVSSIRRNPVKLFQDIDKFQKSKSKSKL